MKVEIIEGKIKVGGRYGVTIHDCGGDSSGLRFQCGVCWRWFRRLCDASRHARGH